MAAEIKALVSVKWSEAWFGLVRGRNPRTDLKFYWASDDSEASDFTDWAPGNPDPPSADQNCITYYYGHSLGWDDKDCATTYRYFCQAG